MAGASQDDIKSQLVSDHSEIADADLAQRYFAKFARINGHLAQVVSEMEAKGELAAHEVKALGTYLAGIAATFQALSWKYLMTGRIASASRLVFDRHESGFPVAQELMLMAVDAQQATRHLSALASEAELKDRMIRQIVGQLTVPADLQFTLSQRLYYQALQTGGLFWARNDPEARWLEAVGERRRYLLHWAVWDHQINLPVVYLMDLLDSGRRPLPDDDRRWPQAQAHLMAQSLSGLKLLTIAKGFDTDFEDLHPKRLRRLHIGPMYSAGFTQQSGPISDVLTAAAAPEGQDWALVWTIEDLRAERAEQVKDGWFSTVERQIFALDPFAGRGAETGATATERMVILPERPYQALAELNPPGFRDVRKYVVGDRGRIIQG